MKLLLNLCISIFITAGLLAMLVSLGYIKIGKSTPKQTVGEISRVAADPLSESINKEASDLHESETNAQTANIPTKNEKTSGGNERPNPLQSSVFEQAQKFLYRFVPGQSKNIEQDFRQFLIDDLNLDTTETEQMVRMCFWKNFVTLQLGWKFKDINKLDRMFEDEMRMKQAGFTAQGLCLVPEDLKAAESRFVNLKNQLSKAISKKNGEDNEINDRHM